MSEQNTDSETPERVLELPAEGGTSADLGTVLTLRELATRLGKSTKTVRRMVTAGVFSQAYQAPIPNGGGQTQWVVPYASVLAWERDQADSPTRSAPATRAQPDERTQEIESLRSEIENLRRDLALAQLQADERGKTNEQLTEALKAMRLALPAVQSQRRWWQRGKSSPQGD